MPPPARCCSADGAIDGCRCRGSLAVAGSAVLADAEKIAELGAASFVVPESGGEGDGGNCGARKAEASDTRQVDRGARN